MDSPIRKSKKVINLIYFDGYKNFGDEISVFVTKKLINHDKYNLVLNKNNSDFNLVCVGSYLHKATHKSYVFGTGVRTDPPTEGKHHYRNLSVSAVRGPLTKQFLEKKGIRVPNIFGDPGLLVAKFYKPTKISSLSDSVGVIPHYHHRNKLQLKDLSQSNKFVIIRPDEGWQTVLDKIYSCRAIISNSLHGLVCSDAYGIPNIWWTGYKLTEGDLKFKDYLMSQDRPINYIENLADFRMDKCYSGGNKIDLQKLQNAFPF